MYRSVFQSCLPRPCCANIRTRSRMPSNPFYLSCSMKTSRALLKIMWRVSGKQTRIWNLCSFHFHCPHIRAPSSSVFAAISCFGPEHSNKFSSIHFTIIYLVRQYMLWIIMTEWSSLRQSLLHLFPYSIRVNRINVKVRWVFISCTVSSGCFCEHVGHAHILTDPPMYQTLSISIYD